MHSHKWETVSGSLRDFPDIGVKKCLECGLVNHETDLRGTVSYESGTMHNWAKGWGDQLAGPKADMSRRVAAITSLIPQTGSVFLDYGCGDAGLVSEMASRGIASYGLDPDAEASHDARSAGIPVFSSVDEIPANLKFDLISLIHVVEHFYDVVQELKSLRRLLKPQGVLLLETPNANDALLSRYQSKEFQNFTYWSHHPNLCTNSYLAEALGDAGFRVVDNTQIQRYGLANHLHWLSTGLPGGHIAWEELSDPSLDSAYGAKLADLGQADTLWIQAQY